MGVVLLLVCLLPNQVAPIDYFLQHRTVHSWVLDKSDDPDIISVAGCGFGMPAWAILSKDGIITHDTALTWCKECFHETLRINKGNRGWLYHFTNLKGEPVFTKEVGTIDAAIFYLGAREAARILKDKDFASEVETTILAIDKKLMLTNNGQYPEKKFFSHGFYWINGKPVFLENNWQEYSEGIILYRLFNLPYEHPPIQYNLPLFVYYYPLCFFDGELKAHLGAALDYQITHFDQLGYTACIGHTGYSIMEKGIISPLALACCEFYYPEKVKNALDHLPGRTVPAYDFVLHKTIPTRIAIDDGAYSLLQYKSRR